MPVAQNCEKRLLDSSCFSVRPHGKTRLKNDGFPWNLMSIFRKYVERIEVSLKREKIVDTLHDYLCKCMKISRWEIFQQTFYWKPDISCSTFSENRAVYEVFTARQATYDKTTCSTRITWRINQVTDNFKMSNAYWFSTSTMAARTGQ